VLQQRECLCGCACLCSQLSSLLVLLRSSRGLSVRELLFGGCLRPREVLICSRQVVNE
jgi:hypothetical protein